MALKLDNSLLDELGLTALPEPEKQSLLRHVYETLEMRVGMRLADQMSNEQLDEFEQFVNANDDTGAFKWLESNFPNYKDVVNDEFEKLKAEVGQVAPQILSQSQQAIAQGSVQQGQAQQPFFQPVQPAQQGQPSQFAQPAQPLQQQVPSPDPFAGMPGAGQPQPLQPFPQQAPPQQPMQPQQPTPGFYQTPPVPAQPQMPQQSDYLQPQTQQQPAQQQAPPQFGPPPQPQYLEQQPPAGPAQQQPPQYPQQPAV
jgi:hypothetical protein